MALTATVSGVSPGGTVTFVDGTSPLGTVALSGGVASSWVAQFAVLGTHSTVARYSGDTSNTAADSSVVPLVIATSGDAATALRWWTRGYDANGNLRFVVDPRGNQTDHGYDRLQQLSSITQPAPQSGAARPVITLGTDALGQTTSVTDPRSLVTSYTISDLGDTTRQVSPDTGTTDATYDALNRLAGIVYSQSGQASRTYNWTYDQTGAGFSHGIGRLTSTASPAASAQYAYDAQGRLTSATQTVNAAAGANSSAVTHTAGYGYDAAGHLTSLTYPSGRQLSITYTAGQPTSVSLAKDASSTPSPLISQIQWVPFGAAKSWLWHLASGTQLHEKTYDTSGRLVRYPLGGAVRDLTYDAADRITGYTHYDAATGTATAAATALNQSFATTNWAD